MDLTPFGASIAASFALDIALEEIITMIAFSPAVQKKPKKRILIYTAIVFLFLAAHAVSVKWMGISMMDYLLEEFASVVGLPVIGFFVNLLIRRHRIMKIRSMEIRLSELKNRLSTLNEASDAISSLSSTDLAEAGELTRVFDKIRRSRFAKSLRELVVGK